MCAKWDLARHQAMFCEVSGSFPYSIETFARRLDMSYRTLNIGVCVCGDFPSTLGRGSSRGRAGQPLCGVSLRDSAFDLCACTTVLILDHAPKMCTVPPFILALVFNCPRH